MRRAEWEATLDELTTVRVVMVIGAAEAGKTTFTAWLANHLHARGLSVGIVDADIGQSEIGPPATVGLGAVRRPLTRSGDAETVDLEFVGVTSPGRQPWRTAEATGRLVARARTRFDRVVVDTSGFVAGGFAAALKQRKITAVDPDVVVAIQAGDECEHILRGLVTRPRPRVVRLPAVHGARPRSPETRRRHREAALTRYFAGARPITLEIARVGVHSLAGAAVALDTLAPGTLMALHGADGGTLALGVLESTDPAAGTLAVQTTVSASEVATITVGATTTAR